MASPTGVEVGSISPINLGAIGDSSTLSSVYNLCAFSDTVLSGFFTLEAGFTIFSAGSGVGIKWATEIFGAAGSKLGADLLSYIVFLVKVFCLFGIFTGSGSFLISLSGISFTTFSLFAFCFCSTSVPALSGMVVFGL